MGQIIATGIVQRMCFVHGAGPAHWHGAYVLVGESASAITGVNLIIYPADTPEDREHKVAALGALASAMVGRLPVTVYLDSVSWQVSLIRFDAAGG